MPEDKSPSPSSRQAILIRWRVLSYTREENRDGAVVTALASHQCGLGSIPTQCHMWWAEFVVGSRLPSRVFLRVAQFHPLHKNQHSK